MAGAEQAARSQVEANPNSAGARVRYAQILYSNGHVDRALREVQAAGVIDPLSPIVQQQWGELALAAGQFDDASKHLQQAIMLDSANAGLHVTLAMTYKEQGRTADANTELKKATGFADADPRALGMVGFAWGQTGQQSEALKIVDQLRQGAETNKAIANTIAQIYMSVGNAEEASAWLKKNPDGTERRGVIAFQSPRWHQAIEHMRADPRIKPLLDSLSMMRVEVHMPGDSLRRRDPNMRGGRSRSGAGQ